MQTAQYWKPGEKKPRDGGSGRRDGDGRTATAVKGNNGERRRDGAEQHSTKSSNGGSAKKRGKMSKGKDKESNSSSSSSSAIGGIDAEVSRSAAKPPVAGPSQGLLAMKVCAERFVLYASPIRAIYPGCRLVKRRYECQGVCFLAGAERQYSVVCSTMVRNSVFFEATELKIGAEWPLAHMSVFVFFWIGHVLRGRKRSTASTLCLASSYR